MWLILICSARNSIICTSGVAAHVRTLNDNRVAAVFENSSFKMFSL